MHELRSGPTKVKGLRRRGQTDIHTNELKGSELYPLSERMIIYVAGLAWPGLAGWLGLAWPDLAWLFWFGLPGWPAWLLAGLVWPGLA